MVFGEDDGERESRNRWGGVRKGLVNWCLDFDHCTRAQEPLAVSLWLCYDIREVASWLCLVI